MSTFRRELEVGIARAMVDAESVLSVVTALRDAGVRVWLDGGWGVDALVGEQTRDHDDLDCVIALTDAPTALDALADLGFAVTLDESPTRFVVRDRSDRAVSGKRSHLMLIYAHRGESAIHPENTLRAFREALAIGVDGLELDVHATADGVPVVIHDRDVGRTTDGLGHVDEIPLARLETFDAGDGERVPTLAEVLELVGGGAHLDVEIKGSGIERTVLEVLAKYPAVRWAISSFAWDTLRTVRRLDPVAELWPLAERVNDDLFAIAAELESPAVSLFTGAYTAETAAKLRDAGLRVVVWTVNDPREARRVENVGAFALCTDDPRRISPIDRTT